MWQLCISTLHSCLFDTYIESFEEADVSNDPHPDEETARAEHQRADVVILRGALGMLGRDQHKSKYTL